MFDLTNDEDFLAAIGVADADEETKAKLIAELNELAEQKLTLRLSDILSDGQAEELKNIQDEEKTHDWIMANVPNIEDIVAEITDEIKNDLMSRKDGIME